MKNKFEIDSACRILGLELELVLNHLDRQQIVYEQIDTKYYTDEQGIEEMEKLKYTQG